MNNMVIIKKPIMKILFLLSSVFGLILVLIGGLFFKNNQYNLSELGNKTKDLFNTDLISKAKADTPNFGGCDGGGGDGCGYGGGDGDGPDGCSSCSGGCASAGSGDSSGDSY